MSYCPNCGGRQVKLFPGQEDCKEEICLYCAELERNVLMTQTHATCSFCKGFTKVTWISSGHYVCEVCKNRLIEGKPLGPKDYDRFKDIDDD